jgi:hypothetical protein
MAIGSPRWPFFVAVLVSALIGGLCGERTMRINLAIPEANVKAPVLDAALEAITRLNEELVRSGVSPTSDQLISAGAKWKPEKPGEEHFDHGGIIAARGHGDCDDWAPLHAASLRVTGVDPGATAIVRKSGPKRWHAIVQRSDGSIDDPSLAAGMPGPARDVGVRGAWVPVMHEPTHDVGGSFIATPHLALRPIADRFGQLESWQARADLPWHWGPGRGPGDVAMASLHQSPVSDQAIVGAVRGAYRLGTASGFAHPEHCKRLAAISAACQGADWAEMADEYGPAHATAAAQVVGSFFGKALKRLKKLASPLLKAGLSFVPGGGLAAAAFNAASPALKHALIHQTQHAPEPPRARAVSSQQRPPAPAGNGAARNGAPSLSHRDFGDMLHRAYTSCHEQPGTAWPPRG